MGFRPRTGLNPRSAAPVLEISRKGSVTRPTDLDLVRELYRKHREPLARVRRAQREFCRDRQGVMTPQLDDLEAEITYLLLRALRPEAVMELGAYHGWSTSWLLTALRDNGTGRLHSFDVVDHAVTNVPPELGTDRWTFRRGDVRTNLDTVPEDIGYLFVDAAHHGRFARWYIDHLFPRIPPGTPVCVHDVFHGKRPLPLTEGAVVLRWLARTGTHFFTASPARAPGVHRELQELKRELGLDEPVRTSQANPMIFFRLPARPGR